MSIKIDTLEECRITSKRFANFTLDTKFNCAAKAQTSELAEIEGAVRKATTRRVVEMIEKQDSGEVPAEYWTDTDGNTWIKREEAPPAKPTGQGQ